MLLLLWALPAEVFEEEIVFYSRDDSEEEDQGGAEIGGERGLRDPPLALERGKEMEREREKERERDTQHNDLALYAPHAASRCGDTVMYRGLLLHGTALWTHSGEILRAVVRRSKEVHGDLLQRRSVVVTTDLTAAHRGSPEAWTGGETPTHFIVQNTDLLLPSSRATVATLNGEEDGNNEEEGVREAGFEAVRWLLSTQVPADVFLQKGGEFRRTPLHCATVSRACSVPLLELLVALCPGAAGEKDRQGNVPLLLLTAFNWGMTSDMVQVLLDADREAARRPGILGYLPLHGAIFSPRADAAILRLLIEAYPEATLRKNQHGNYPLHMLVGYDNKVVTTDMVDIVLEANPDALLTPGAYGRLPLHVGVRTATSTVDVLQHLVDQAPEAASTRDAHGNLPAHIYFAFNKDLSLEVASVVVSAYPGALHELGYGARLPLHALCCNSAITTEVLDFLITLDRDAAAVADDQDQLPLHVYTNTSKSLNPEVLTMIVAANQDALRTPSADGRLPLHHAAHNSFVTAEALFTLLEAHSDAARTVDRQGATPLHLMTSYHKQLDEMLVLVLLEAHHNAVRAKDQFHRLPLHGAARNAALTVTVLDLLLQAYPESASIPDKWGRLPLHIMLEYNYAASKSIDLISVFVDANPSALATRGQYGNLPLHSCALNVDSSPDVMLYLLSNYPEASGLLNEHGNLALHLCLSVCSAECAHVLVQFTNAEQWARVMHVEGDRSINTEEAHHDNGDSCVHIAARRYVDCLKRGDVESAFQWEMLLCHMVELAPNLILQVNDISREMPLTTLSGTPVLDRLGLVAIPEFIAQQPWTSLRLHLCGDECSGKTSLRAFLAGDHAVIEQLGRASAAATAPASVLKGTAVAGASAAAATTGAGMSISSASMLRLTRTHGAEVHSLLLKEPPTTQDTTSIMNSAASLSQVHPAAVAAAPAAGVSAPVSPPADGFEEGLEEEPLQVFDHGGQTRFHVMHTSLFAGQRSAFVLVIPTRFPTRYPFSEGMPAASSISAASPGLAALAVGGSMGASNGVHQHFAGSPVSSVRFTSSHSDGEPVLSNAADDVSVWRKQAGEVLQRWLTLLDTVAHPDSVITVLCNEWASQSPEEAELRASMLQEDLLTLLELREIEEASQAANRTQETESDGAGGNDRGDDGTFVGKANANFDDDLTVAGRQQQNSGFSSVSLASFAQGRPKVHRDAFGVQPGRERYASPPRAAKRILPLVQPTLQRVSLDPCGAQGLDELRSFLRRTCGAIRREMKMPRLCVAAARIMKTIRAEERRCMVTVRELTERLRAVFRDQQQHRGVHLSPAHAVALAHHLEGCGEVLCLENYRGRGGRRRALMTGTTAVGASLEDERIVADPHFFCCKVLGQLFSQQMWEALENRARFSRSYQCGPSSMASTRVLPCDVRAGRNSRYLVTSQQLNEWATMPGPSGSATGNSNRLVAHALFDGDLNALPQLLCDMGWCVRMTAAPAPDAGGVDYAVEQKRDEAGQKVEDAEADAETEARAGDGRMIEGARQPTLWLPLFLLDDLLVQSRDVEEALTLPMDDGGSAAAIRPGPGGPSSSTPRIAGGEVWVRAGRRVQCGHKAQTVQTQAFMLMQQAVLSRFVRQQENSADTWSVYLWADGALARRNQSSTNTHEKTAVLLRHIWTGEASDWGRTQAVDVYVTGSLHTPRDWQALLTNSGAASASPPWSTQSGECEDPDATQYGEGSVSRGQRPVHRVQQLVDDVVHTVVLPAIAQLSQQGMQTFVCPLQMGEAEMRRAYPVGVPETHGGLAQGHVIRGDPEFLLRSADSSAPAPAPAPPPASGGNAGLKRLMNSKCTIAKNATTSDRAGRRAPSDLPGTVVLQLRDGTEVELTHPCELDDADYLIRILEVVGRAASVVVRAVIAENPAMFSAHGSDGGGNAASTHDTYANLKHMREPRHVEAYTRYLQQSPTAFEEFTRCLQDLRRSVFHGSHGALTAISRIPAHSMELRFAEAKTFLASTRVPEAQEQLHRLHEQYRAQSATLDRTTPRECGRQVQWERLPADYVRIVLDIVREILLEVNERLGLELPQAAMMTSAAAATAGGEEEDPERLVDVQSIIKHVRMLHADAFARELDWDVQACLSDILALRNQLAHQVIAADCEDDMHKLCGKVTALATQARTPWAQHNVAAWQATFTRHMEQQQVSQSANGGERTSTSGAREAGPGSGGGGGSLSPPLPPASVAGRAGSLSQRDGGTGNGSLSELSGGGATDGDGDGGDSAVAVAAASVDKSADASIVTRCPHTLRLHRCLALLRDALDDLAEEIADTDPDAADLLQRIPDWLRSHVEEAGILDALATEGARIQGQIDEQTAALEEAKKSRRHRARADAKKALAALAAHANAAAELQQELETYRLALGADANVGGPLLFEPLDVRSILFAVFRCGPDGELVPLAARIAAAESLSPSQSAVIRWLRGNGLTAELADHALQDPWGALAEQQSSASSAKIAALGLPLPSTSTAVSAATTTSAGAVASSSDGSGDGGRSDAAKPHHKRTQSAGDVAGVSLLFGES